MSLHSQGRKRAFRRGSQRSELEFPCPKFGLPDASIKAQEPMRIGERDWPQRIGGHAWHRTSLLPLGCPSPWRSLGNSEKPHRFRFLLVLSAQIPNKGFGEIY